MCYTVLGRYDDATVVNLENETVTHLNFYYGHDLSAKRTHQTETGIDFNSSVPSTRSFYSQQKEEEMYGKIERQSERKNNGLDRGACVSTCY